MSIDPIGRQTSLRVLRITSLAGIAGSVIMAVTSLITALAYVGNQGQRYSPLNHFVSELGEVGVSQLAAVFNIGLIIGGICFVIFMAGLALYFRKLLTYLFSLLGIISGIAGALVGVFPMNNLDAHVNAALTFFNLGWVAVGLFSLYIWLRRDEALPRWLSIVGLVSVVSFIGFLMVLRVPGQIPESGLGSPTNRIDVWWVTIFEWMIIVTILSWVFLVSFCLLRYAQRSGA